MHRAASGRSSARLSGMTQKPERLYLLAQEIAERTSGFFAPLGAGGANIRSNAFMSELRSSAKQVFGQDYSEAKVCGDNKLANFAASVLCHKALENILFVL
jgi:hypothetical protein